MATTNEWGSTDAAWGTQTDPNLWGTMDTSTPTSATTGSVTGYNPDGSPIFGTSYGKKALGDWRPLPYQTLTNGYAFDQYGNRLLSDQQKAQGMTSWPTEGTLSTPSTLSTGNSWATNSTMGGSSDKIPISQNTNGTVNCVSRSTGKVSVEAPWSWSSGTKAQAVGQTANAQNLAQTAATNVTASPMGATTGKVTGYNQDGSPIFGTDYVTAQQSPQSVATGPIVGYNPDGTPIFSTTSSNDKANAINNQLPSNIWNYNELFGGLYGIDYSKYQAPFAINESQAFTSTGKSTRLASELAKQVSMGNMAWDPVTETYANIGRESVRLPNNTLQYEQDLATAGNTNPWWSTYDIAPGQGIDPGWGGPMAGLGSASKIAPLTTDKQAIRSDDYSQLLNLAVSSMGKSQDEAKALMGQYYTMGGMAPSGTGRSYNSEAGMAYDMMGRLGPLFGGQYKLPTEQLYMRQGGKIPSTDTGLYNNLLPQSYETGFQKAKAEWEKDRNMQAYEWTIDPLTGTKPWDEFVKAGNKAKQITEEQYRDAPMYQNNNFTFSNILDSIANLYNQKLIG